jgi:hypothetical protein
MNSGSGGQAGDGHVIIGREMWGELLVALQSDDREFRMDLFSDLLRLAPVGWDADIAALDRPPGRR